MTVRIVGIDCAVDSSNLGLASIQRQVLCDSKSDAGERIVNVKRCRCGGHQLAAPAAYPAHDPAVLEEDEAARHRMLSPGRHGAFRQLEDGREEKRS